LALVTPKFDVRAKVKVGKTVDRGGRQLPTSTDTFLCDDDEFYDLYGEDSSEIRVLLAYPTPELSFVQTLETWRGKVLFCRSSDGRTAYRKTSDGRTLDVQAQARENICPHRDCEFYRDGSNAPCRETGRLRFFLEKGENRSSCLEFVTHGYGSLESIAATVMLGGRLGDLTLAPGTLSVRFEQKGNKRFPVVSLDLDSTASADVSEVDEVKAILRQIGEYDNPEFRAYVERVGASAALVQLRRHPRYTG